MCVKMTATEKRSSPHAGSLGVNRLKSKRRLVKHSVQKYRTPCKKRRTIRIEQIASSYRPSCPTQSLRSDAAMKAVEEEQEELQAEEEELSRPMGSMAPRNTTQYLMELACRDMPTTCDFELSRLSIPVFTADEHSGHSSPPYRLYASVYTDEEVMDFQRRDFDSVFFHEL